MEHDQWDFSAYGMDFSKTDKVAEPSPAKDSPAGHEAPQGTANREVVVVPPEETSLFPPREEKADSPSKAGQTVKQQEEKEPISKEEILDLSANTDKSTEIVNSWIEQLTDIRDHSEKRLPKGIRVSIRRLNDMTDALQASKVILENIATKDDRLTRKIFEDKKIPYSIKMMTREIEQQNKRMAQSIQVLKTAIDTEDPEARTLAREMKSTVLASRSQAEMLANAVTQFILAYPAKHGEFALFSEIAATGDEKAMTQIDRMILLTENMVVTVADAPAMIKAIEKKDTDRMTEILDRMIENQSVRKTS